MAKFGKLATLVTAAEAARQYAKKNPEQAGRFLDQAAAFVDKQTKGKFSAKISDAARKVKGVAGIPAGQPPYQAAPNQAAPNQAAQYPPAQNPVQNPVQNQAEQPTTKLPPSPAPRGTNGTTP